MIPQHSAHWILKIEILRMEDILHAWPEKFERTLTESVKRFLLFRMSVLIFFSWFFRWIEQQQTFHMGLEKQKKISKSIKLEKHWELRL